MITKASIKLLRVTIPADLYTSGISAEIEGIEVQVDADTKSQDDPAVRRHEVREYAIASAQRHTTADRPRSLKPRIYDPGGGATVLYDGAQGGEKDSDQGVLPTTDDLAKSFLQAEPRHKKAELQAAVAQSQRLDESDILEDSGQDTAVGVGNRLSLPAFLSGFLKGIRDRFCLKLKDVKVDLSIRVDLPSTRSSTTAASDRSETVTIRLFIKSVDYSNVLQSESITDSKSVRLSTSTPSKSTPSVEDSQWIRRISFSDIEGAVLSDASIFSSLLRSPAPSSSSESTVAVSPSKTRRSTQHEDDDVGNAPNLVNDPVSTSHSLDLDRDEPQSQTSLSGASYKPHSDDEVDPEQNLVSIAGRPEPAHNPTIGQDSTQDESIFSSFYSNEGSSISERNSGSVFPGSQNQNVPGSLEQTTSSLSRPKRDKLITEEGLSAVLRKRHVSHGNERLSGFSIPIVTSSPESPDHPSPSAEDLTESRIFSHEEAESMYMSAMSNTNPIEMSVNKAMPGAWGSHVSDDEIAARTPAMSARARDNAVVDEDELHGHDLAIDELTEQNSTPIHSSSSNSTKYTAPGEESDIFPVYKAAPISNAKSAQVNYLQASSSSEAGTEGSLVVSKPFALIDHMCIEFLHDSNDAASTLEISSYSEKDTSTFLSGTTSLHFPAGSQAVQGENNRPNIQENSEQFDHARRQPGGNAHDPSAQSVTFVKVGTVEFNTDMGLARLTASIIRQMSKVFPDYAATKRKDNSVTDTSRTEIKMTVEKLAWHFYDRVVGSPVVEDPSSSTQLGRDRAFVGSELLLQATIHKVYSVSQTSASSYKSTVSMAKVAFGYASGNILSFDSNLKMRESTRDIFAPTGNDLVLTISKDPRSSKIELSTLPIHVHLDLRRLDETFAWLGGFSSILDLGNSMVSTVTTLEPKRSNKKRAGKSSRGVHFETPDRRGSADTDTSLNQVARKITARIGGVTCTLLGSESSLQIEGTALKVVSRAEGLGLQIDRFIVSGLYLKSPADQPSMMMQLFNVRTEYLPEPKEVDLARLLALLSPSRDKYEGEDDILLDTLLRQRRQGSVIRLTAESSENHISNVDDLRYFSILGEELKKLATVAKYLPEDDRPGILTLALIRQFRCEAQIHRSFGTIDINMKNTELAHVSLPSLFALGVSDVHVCRNKEEQLVAAGTSQDKLEENPLPMIMARFIGNEMEPTVKLKLYNVCVEYHVPFVVAVMNFSGNLQAEDVLTDMAGSISALTERTHCIEEPPASPQVSVSSGKPDKFTALKLDVTVRDSLIALNPRNPPSKGVLLLTETHFAGTVPRDQEANATLEIQKAALMIIDDQNNIKQPEVYVEHMSAQSKVSQLQRLEAIGYVSVSTISAARAVLQITQDQENSSRSIELEIKDDLFVLESCADSTQTLQTILNGLAPPLPRSKDVKYRTEVVPIEDMLASFSGMEFTPSGARVVDHYQDEASQPNIDAEAQEDEDLQGSFYDLESSGQYDGVSDSIFDEHSGSAMVDQSNQAFEEGSSSLSLDDQDQDEVEGLPLEFKDDHFGSTSSVGGTAHRWNTKQNTYGLSNESRIRKSPLRVKVRDVHVIWNLFDGYDWQRTRDTISQAIAEVETKALNRQSKRERRKPQEMDEEEESVIGDFLFNSIYIGIPANRDPRNLARQVSRNLDDVASESESSAPTTVSTSSSHPNAPTLARTKRPRLARSKHHKMTFELRGISADLVVFPPRSGETQSSIDIRVQDLEIFDHVPTSTWKKFATYMQDAGERESGTSMIHLEILNVRPVAELVASEIILKATILPLRLHVDQDALDFMTRFFEFKNDEVKEASAKGEAAFLQRVEVNSVRLRLDFKPKRVDYAGIRSGHTNEFMNFFILDRADMVLRHVIIYGISGFDRLGKTLNDIWMPDIKRNQLPGVLAGLAPVRSLVNVGGGVRDLVVVPIREYQKDGRIVRSLQKGALAFAKTTTSELVKLGAKLAIGTQTVLQGAENLLTLPEQQRPEAAGGWEEADLDEDEKKHISLYADQPVGVIQGLRGAYASLERDLLTAKDAIVAMPGEVLESGTAGGAAKAVMKGAPTVILRPALGVSKAVGRTLMGATNSLDPENRRRIEEVSETLCCH